MERNWGDNHQAWLYAKFLRKVRDNDLDPGVYAIAKKEFGSVENFNEKVLAYQIACVTSWRECDIEPYYQMGKLPSLGKIIIGRSGDEEIPFDNREFPEGFGLHTKVIFEVGSLYERRDGYEIETYDCDDSMPYGFWACIWNNHSASMDQDKCKKMLEVYVDAIQKYSHLIEIVETGSY